MKKFISFLLAAFSTTVLFAQTGGADVNVDVTKSGGSSIPWMWIIIGAVVLIVLIVALTRGGGGGGTTVIKD